MQGGVKHLIPKLLERGVIKQYKTWEEVAAAYDVPLEALEKTVADYNVTWHRARTRSLAAI